MSGLSYSGAGVDTGLAARETGALAKILAQTAAFRSGPGEPLLENGYYASALRLTDDLALAICMDGVGSKLLVAEAMGSFLTVGIDCIAMNVNDLICIGAEPLCMVDYVAVEHLEPGVMEEVAKGLLEGARQARISIPGGETAQLPDMIRGLEPGKGLDLVGTAIGICPPARLNCGADVKAGDVVIGVRSSGVHSNGFTLARKALLDKGGLTLDTHRDELGTTIGRALLEPTRIYVAEAMELFASDIPVKALCHITGDGFMNLARVKAPVGWVLDALPDPHPIFSLIQSSGGVSGAEMHTVFNMGVGLCAVVPEKYAEHACAILAGGGAEATVIGRAVAAPARTVRLPQRGLVGTGTTFAEA